MTTHEKVILVGVETEKNYQTFSASMEELANLTETANGVCFNTKTTTS